MSRSSVNLYKLLNKNFNKSVKFGLKRIKLALSLLGNPERKLKNVISVIGESGKFSTMYALKSFIEKGIVPGAKVKGGELLGKSGNTGMRESTIGSKAGSHLHWELILQKEGKEIYLGKGMSNPELYDMLSRIFTQ